jgi:hypothetical protein
MAKKLTDLRELVVHKKMNFSINLKLQQQKHLQLQKRTKKSEIFFPKKRGTKKTSFLPLLPSIVKGATTLSMTTIGIMTLDKSVKM